jgi:hypothetical protein
MRAGRWREGVRAGDSFCFVRTCRSGIAWADEPDRATEALLHAEPSHGLGPTSGNAGGLASDPSWRARPNGHLRTRRSPS